LRVAIRPVIFDSMAYFEITDREQLLAQYENDVAVLHELVGKISDDVLHFRPASEGAWTIAEHLGHLASTEVNGYLRFQKAILNPGTTIDTGGGDMEKSAAILGYDVADSSDIVRLLGLLRAITLAHARRIQGEDWSKYRIEQPTHPVMKAMSLGMILSFQSQHFALHLDFIRRNLNAHRLRA
jgi:hypothetical protein